MGKQSTVRAGEGGRRQAEKSSGFFERLERQQPSGQNPGADLSSQPTAQPPVRGERQELPERRAAGGRPAVASATAVAAGAAGAGALEAARAGLGTWGWLPALIFLSGVGTVLVAQAMRLALTASPLAQPLFWAGVLMIYAPVALRMALPNVQRRERIALAIWVGLALFLVRVLRSSGGFIFHDEFPHYDTVNDILRTGSLFQTTSLQEVSAFFPGLEIVTAALASITGLSIEAAGMVVIGAARLIASLGIYLLYEEISGSPRVAGIGAMIAIAYPNYTYWSSQFSYESLALPMAVLVLLAGLWSSRRTTPGTRMIVLAVLLLASVVVIHHVTSYFLAVSLIVLYVASRERERVVTFAERIVSHVPRFLKRLLPATLWRKPSERSTDPHAWGVLAVVAMVAAGAWLATVGHKVISYLAPHLAAASQGFLALFLKQGASAHKPFTPSAGATQAAPVLEQLVAFGAVLLIMFAIPFGLLQIWRRYRGHAMAVLFGLASLAYPATLLLRLASGGPEIANRSWDFLFIALGFVVAAGVAELWMARGHVMSRAVVFALYACIVYTGGFVVGMPGWARLPGPYMVGGDTRGLQAESYALSDWARATVGPDHRFIADSTNKLLLGAYGEQYIVDGLSWVYVSPKLTKGAEFADLLGRNTQYIVVDDRVTKELPRQGFYFEEGEPERPYKAPFDPKKLEKFDQAACLSRVFDSGHITVYAVSSTCTAGGGGTQ